MFSAYLCILLRESTSRDTQCSQAGESVFLFNVKFSHKTHLHCGRSGSSSAGGCWLVCWAGLGHWLLLHCSHCIDQENSRDYFLYWKNPIPYTILSTFKERFSRVGGFIIKRLWLRPDSEPCSNPPGDWAVTPDTETRIDKETWVIICPGPRKQRRAQNWEHGTLI